MGSALPPEILEALTRGQTILTANQRAARTLRHAYDQAHQSAGETLSASGRFNALKMGRG